DASNELRQQVKVEVDASNELRQQVKVEVDASNELRQQVKSEVDVSNELRQQLNNCLNMYNEISNAACWKMTKPIRLVADKIKSTRTGYLVYKTLVYVKDGGILYAARKVKKYIKKKRMQALNESILDIENGIIKSFKGFVEYFNDTLKNEDNYIYKIETLLNYDFIEKISDDKGKVILMVTHELELTGAPVALYYFAKSLKDNGHYPVFISPSDGKLAQDIADNDIPVIIYNSIFTSNLSTRIASLFDYVVANTIVSHPIINRLSDKDIPVIWWIHEAVVSYNDEVLLALNQTVTSNIHIYSGGGYAKKVLRSYRQFYHINELLYYVPEIDELETKSFSEKESSDKIVFAIIGMQEDRKGQDVLADAIFKLPKKDREKALFVFIGRQCSSRVYEKVQQVIRRFPNDTKYIEELGQDSLHRFYQQMDCLICASKDDPMPIVVTEAMMLSKLIICSENTGSAELIREMQSGMVYTNNDSSELAQKISYVINNLNNLNEQRIRARLTYEKYFSKVVFDYNVENIIREIGRKNIPIRIPFVSETFSMVNLINIWKRDYKKRKDFILGEDILGGYDCNRKGRKILLISHELSLTGAPIALHHFAKTLIEKGDCPIVMSPFDGNMKDEFLNDNIPVIVYNEIYSEDFLEKYNGIFDLIVMNTVVTYRAIYSFANSEVPIIWWIHDSNASYEIGGFRDCLPKNLPKCLKIYCGGEYAKEALLRYYPNYKADILLYDVPDLTQKKCENLKVDIGAKEGIFTFTTIGMQDDRKGHDVFVEAIDLLDQEIIKKCQFVFVGRKYSDAIWKKIEYICSKYPNNTKFIEEVTRDELIHVYKQSDCIVCCSKDDPMPIFVTEAMLMSKVIICSENTGSAKLIQRMNSGLIYEENSPKLLMEKIQYVYEHIEELDYIKENARKTYEKYFSEKVFKDQIIEIIENISPTKDDNYYNGSVSIVIPTFNAGEIFKTLIQLLKSQKHIAKIEIIVVDSGSKDDTVKICKKEGVNLLQISQEAFSHSFARNMGAEHSTGDFIIFMTQDAMPTSTLWISNLIQPLINEGVAAVSCTEICKEDIDLYYKISSWSHEKYIGVDKEDKIFTYNKTNDIETLRKNASLNDVTCAVNHKIFNNFKYRFNYAEDLDLGVRLIKAGYKIKIMSSEKVIHGHNRSAGYYIKRTIVENKALNIILNKKQEVKSVTHVCKRIIIGYKGINKIICNLREELQHKMSSNDFFEHLDAQFKNLITEDIFNLEVTNLAYNDIILDELMDRVEYYGNNKSFGEMNDIIYMCKHYSDEFIRKYISAHYSELNVELLESIYDALYKQMAVFIGLDLSSMEEIPELKQYLDTLTKGV
ncbi:glycosyltransferase, partial [Clostridium sp.]|uniref:glycosyltransferase n=1 Tax=Clostridium sp. TaxID=1506 RepID=UPI002846BAF7